MPITASVPSSFSTLLKRWRGSVRQKNAADVLGVNIDTFQNWEEGRAEPDKWKRQALEKLMAEKKASAE